MARPRVIPVLLVSRRRGGLVKGVRFRDHGYIGDPINAVKVFNDKSVDEIAIIDIDATRDGRGPDFDWVEEICGEAFMPLAYGGGISRVEQVKELIQRGAEKVIVNSAALRSPGLVYEAGRQVGSQSVVVSIDVSRASRRGWRVYECRGQRDTRRDPVEFAREMEAAGAGEILLTSIDREGTFSGYDIELVRHVSKAIGIPVIASGGARDLEDFSRAIGAGAAAVAAGSMFVFFGRLKGVLINYPAPETLGSIARAG